MSRNAARVLPASDAWMFVPLPSLPALAAGGCSVDADCDDGLFCNGVESCGVGGVCTQGLPVDCFDGVGCTADACNEFLDTCTHIAVDAVCDDGAFCNGVEQCDAAADCRPGMPVSCDDGIRCTVDQCDEPLRACVNQVDHGRCDDGVICNGAESCSADLGCLAGPEPECDDSIDCTADACIESLGGCVHQPVDVVCDDSVFCNGVETCDAAEGCVGGTRPACDDGVGCTEDSCDSLLDACRHTARDSVCDDGAFCNGAEVCDASAGCIDSAQAACNDAIDCTADACDEARDTCVHVGVDEVCDDGQFCNGAEFCNTDAGCEAGSPPETSDGVGCTIDRCDEISDRVVHEIEPGLCADGLYCNGTEICDPQEGCVSGEPVDCDDGVECTLDGCDEFRKACGNIPSAIACDDGLFCNGAEVCDADSGCRQGSSPVLDDGIGCTIDLCDESEDRILHEPEQSLCTDGEYCNGLEVCDPDLGCRAGEPIDCDDGVDCTLDGCDEFQDACGNIPSNATCDDGVFCNGAERCDAGSGCAAGPAPLCDDGLSCTEDLCDTVTDRCIALTDDTLCESGNPCMDSSCDPIDGCVLLPNIEPCDDGDACTTDSRCENGQCGAGVPVVCDDGNPCTDERCDAVTGCVALANTEPCDDGDVCTTDDRCENGQCGGGDPVVCDDGNPCTDERCDAVTGCATVPNTEPCDDGNLCTTDDRCSEGACTGGRPLDCDDGNVCTTDSCDQNLGCERIPVECDDGDACTFESCDAGVGCLHEPLDCSLLDADCLVGVCDPDAGVCVSEPVPAGECLVAGCETNADCGDADPCSFNICGPAQECVVVPRDCDDADACTVDTCDPLAGCRHEAVDCDDGVDCTFDACEPLDGCAQVPVDALCRDDLYCNGEEYCDASLGCMARDVPMCGDGDPCTADTCSDLLGSCVHEAHDVPFPGCSEAGCDGEVVAERRVIDFECMAAGTVVSEARPAGGGTPVGVVATNPAMCADMNAAVIYDSSCPGGCSGGDDDLGTPNRMYGGPGVSRGGANAELSNHRALGKVLIVAESLVDADGDGLVDEPDDQADELVSVLFDFTATGPVTLHSLVLIDIEPTGTPARIEALDAAGVPIAVVSPACTGDNGVAEVSLGDIEGVSYLVISIDGSGAVDEIEFTSRRCDNTAD